MCIDCYCGKLAELTGSSSYFCESTGGYQIRNAIYIIWSNVLCRHMSSDKCVANLDISRPVLDNFIRKHCIQQRGETDKFAT